MTLMWHHKQHIYFFNSLHIFFNHTKTCNQLNSVQISHYQLTKNPSKKIETLNGEKNHCEYWTSQGKLQNASEQKKPPLNIKSNIHDDPIKSHVKLTKKAAEWNRNFADAPPLWTTHVILSAPYLKKYILQTRLLELIINSNFNTISHFPYSLNCD